MTAADVQRVARQYLVDRRTGRVVITMPKAAAAGTEDCDGEEPQMFASDRVSPLVGVLDRRRSPARRSATQVSAPASQAVVLKGRAPVSTEMLKVKLPRPAGSRPRRTACI